MRHPATSDVLVLGGVASGLIGVEIAGCVVVGVDYVLHVCRVVAGAGHM